MTALLRTSLRSLAVTLLISPLTALAETASIQLADGSTIRGEIVSLRDGSYHIQTDTLGVLNIPQDKVRVVEYGASNNSASTNSVNKATQPPAAANSQIAAIASQLQNSPALLGNIQSLSSDPAIMAIVQDPEIQRLIANGDYLSLMTNPKMQSLMNNPKIRELTNKLK